MKRSNWIRGAIPGGAAALVAALVVVLQGCAGLFGGPSERLTNAELVIVHFASIHGELLECG